MSSVCLLLTSFSIAYTRRLETLSAELQQPKLAEYLRRFLYDEVYPELELGADVPLDTCPPLSQRTRIAVYNSARAVFYAPSEAAGVGGMHQEYIRCTPNWYNLGPQYDTMLVNIDEDAVGMLGMMVARVRAFLSFVYDTTRYECALVEWFEVDGDHPDPVTGMWTVKPEMVNGARVSSIIPISSIVRACHLIGFYGRTRLPVNFSSADSLVAFRRYYVNWFIDYHAHETVI